MKPRDRRRLLVWLCLLVVLAGLIIVTVVSLMPGPADAPAAQVTSGPDDDPEGAAPTWTPAPDPAVAASQRTLVEAEDARLKRLTKGVKRGQRPFVLPGSSGVLPTTVLTPRAQPYDLASLAQLGAAIREPDGAWLLRHNVAVGNGAKLDVVAPGGTLRLASGPDGFASIIAFKASVTLAGAAGDPLWITSWTGTGPDTRTDDGRAYIRAVGSRMDVRQAAIDGLGFWSGRTSGLAWTGTSTAPAMGSATDVVITGGHYGAYTSRTDGVAFTNMLLRGNLVDGLMIRRGSAGVVAQHVVAADNGNDGIVVARGAHDVRISDSSATGNRGDGISIDGTPSRKAPAATAATVGAAVGEAPGAPTTADESRRAAGFLVERTSVTGNTGDGIVVSSADDVRLERNTVLAEVDAVVLRGPANGIALTGNSLTAQRYGVAITAGVTGAMLHDNVVPAAQIGVHVADTAAELRGNNLTASRYAVALVGQAGGSTVAGNHLAGTGLAALDAGRLAPGAAPTVADNDTSAWVIDRDELSDAFSYVRDHPILLLWVLILGALVVARFVTQRRRRRGEHPYAQQVSAAEPVRLPDPATGPQPVISPDERPIQVGYGPDVESTAALPVTRVTLVSTSGDR